MKDRIRAGLTEVVPTRGETCEGTRPGCTFARRSRPPFPSLLPLQITPTNVDRQTDRLCPLFPGRRSYLGLREGGGCVVTFAFAGVTLRCRCCSGLPAEVHRYVPLK